jgi:hypothetical protein
LMWWGWLIVSGIIFTFTNFLLDMPSEEGSELPQFPPNLRRSVFFLMVSRLAFSGPRAPHSLVDTSFCVFTECVEGEQ